MQIKRDYSEPFFGPRRRKNGRITTLLSLLAIGFLIYVATQREQIPPIVNSAVEQIMGDPSTPTPQPGELAQRASDAYMMGQFDKAAALYEQAVQERPDDIDYLYEYGQTLIDLGDADTALEIADQIIDLDSYDPRGFALKTRALVWRGESALAIPIGRAGLEVDPGFGPLYSALAMAYTNIDSWTEGLKYGELAIRLAPGDVNAHRAYAQALTAVGEFDLAMQQLNQAIELQPNYTPPYFELALLYVAQNRDLEAIDIYDRIRTLEPRNPRALLRLCQTYRKIGQFEQALGFCEDAVEADPTYADAFFSLGALYYRNLRFEESRAAFQSCVDLSPGSLGCMYRLGLSHFYLGDCEKGWDLLQDSLVMAQSREDPGTAIDDIRLGLSAISDDATCAAELGLAIQPTSTPDATSSEGG